MEKHIKLKELTLLNEIGKEFSSSLDLDSVIDAIMSRVKDVLECEASSVILHDDIKDSLVFYAVSGVGASTLKGLSIPLDSGIAGWVFTHRSPLMVGDVSADERFYPGVDRLTGVNTHSLVCVPIEKHDKVLGVIEAVNKRENGFTDRDVDMLTAISQLAAISIENSIIHKNLEQKNSMLQMMNREMEEFVHIVSHDLQTPLVSIDGYADLIRESLPEKTADREDTLSYLDHIEENARNMLRFIRRLLNFIRVEKDFLSFDEFDAKSVVDEVLALLDGEIRRREARIEVPGRLCILRYDRYLFHHIILNVLQNSLKYSSEDRKPLVNLACSLEGGFHHFSVSDNGPGLSAHERETVFKIYERGRQRHLAEGHGIGLAFVKKAVEMSGGSVWIETEPGRGTTVHFTIPR